MNVMNTDGQKELSVTQIRNILKKEFELHLTLKLEYTVIFQNYVVMYSNKSYYLFFDHKMPVTVKWLKLGTLTDAAWIIFNKKKTILKD